ncbi:hypothetical protein [Bacillus cereus]|uniref:hypothetical protein n=1 Tax=Bacillus cereus TaxID=1396 RepID=UPI000BF7C57D|nr:hypothetical protein [Bacillus cereus]PER04891.1 hypothetical protein CN489_30990 [Bacillus cereus]
MDQKCRLCGEGKELIKSHIVPEGFYKNMYDNKNRLFLSSQSRNGFITMQKGQREELLCIECDSNLIGNKYDKYGIQVIRDRLHIQSSTDYTKETWEGLDYNKFKIFLLSVLWRAHIAQKFHKGITLDENTETLIVKAIKSGQAPKENVIPIVGISLVDPKDKASKCDEIITNGNTYTRTGQKYSKTCIIIFGGYAWTFIVPNAEINDPQEEFFLKENGLMVLPKQNIRNFPPITDIMNSIIFANDNFKRINRSNK